MCRRTCFVAEMCSIYHFIDTSCESHIGVEFGKSSDSVFWLLFRALIICLLRKDGWPCESVGEQCNILLNKETVWAFTDR